MIEYTEEEKRLAWGIVNYLRVDNPLGPQAPSAYDAALAAIRETTGRAIEICKMPEPVPDNEFARGMNVACSLNVNALRAGAHLSWTKNKGR